MPTKEIQIKETPKNEEKLVKTPNICDEEKCISNEK